VGSGLTGVKDLPEREPHLCSVIGHGIVGARAGTIVISLLRSGEPGPL
jgi:hypothetical protein